MNNETLWQLTAASVSSVQSVNPDERFHEVVSFSEHEHDLVVTVCSSVEKGQANTAWISEVSHRTIRKRNFAVNNFRSNSSDSNNKVYMVK